MKVYSNGRSEIIEQAWRKSFHMGFDIDIPAFGISMEADLSLPTKSNRKISMMTSFNEELYNSAADFVSKVKIFDTDMVMFTDDMIVTLVTKMIHNTIQRLNEKWEPLWNIFIKTPKAKAKELEQIRDDFLGKPTTQQNEVINKVDDIDIWLPPIEIPEKKPKKTATKKVITKKTTKLMKPIIKSKLPSTKINENPFSNNKTF